MSQLSQVNDEEWLEEGDDEHNDGLVDMHDDDEEDDDNDSMFADNVISTIAARAIVPSATSNNSLHSSSSTTSTSSATFKSLSRMRLNTDKAGMEGLDTQKINGIIEEASKGSRFSQHQERKQRDNERAIGVMLARLARATPAELRQAERDADVILARLEADAAAVLDRVFMHVDMDAFYCSVEARDDPRFGVRAGMPGFIGKKLCPHLEFVKSNFTKYREASHAVRDILSQYDPHLVSYSLDEALCDVTDWLAANPTVTPTLLAERIQAQVIASTKLTCSIGIGNNAGVAKIGANFRKPNGTFQVASDRKSVIEFVQALAVNKVPGIGKVLQAHLAALGVTTVGDIFARRAAVVLLFTPASKNFVLGSSIGAFSTRTTSERHAPRKSMSVERTTKAISDPDELIAFLRSLCEKLAQDLAEKDLRGHSLTVKAKCVSFVVKSRAARVDPAVGGDDVERLFANAKELLLPLMPVSIRLLGVRVAAFMGQEDEVETNANQPRIDEFLSGKRATREPTAAAVAATTATGESSSKSSGAAIGDAQVESFGCPVCNIDLSGRRAVEASIHVDRCLAGQPSRAPSSGSSSPPARNKRVVGNSSNSSSSSKGQSSSQSNANGIARFFKATSRD